MSGRNACDACGATYRPYFGQWYRTQWGSKWYCDDCAQAIADKTKKK